jgi:RHS repeat-associated protein
VPWYGDLPQGQLDASGKMYMRNRYYDPSTGRFTQEDPIGLAGGSNLYGFAGGDPVNFSDPFGLCKDQNGHSRSGDFCPETQGLKGPGLLDPVAWVSGGITVALERGLATVPAKALLATGAKAARVQANKVAGDAFRDEIASAFESNGYGVAKEVGKRTPFGRRVVDLEVTRNGNVLGGIEAKAGSSRYLPWQMAKDAYLGKAGYPVQVVRDATVVKATRMP